MNSTLGIHCPFLRLPGSKLNINEWHFAGSYLILGTLLVNSDAGIECRFSSFPRKQRLRWSQSVTDALPAIALSFCTFCTFHNSIPSLADVISNQAIIFFPLQVHSIIGMWLKSEQIVSRNKLELTYTILFTPSARRTMHQQYAAAVKWDNYKSPIQGHSEYIHQNEMIIIKVIKKMYYYFRKL